MPGIDLHNQRLRYIFDNAKVGMAICNAVDNRLEMVNPAFAAIHGYETHELIGVSPGEVFAPECMIRLSEYEQNPSGACAMEDVSFETVHIRKDGSKIPVSVHITVIRDDKGHITQRIANIIDISDKMRHQAELKALSDNLPGFAFTYEISNEGGERFVYISSGIGKLFGIEPNIPIEDLSIIKSLIHPEDFLRFQSKIKRLFTHPEPFHAEYRICHPKEGTLWFETRATPIHNADGRVQWHGITLDITDRKMVTKQIEFMAQHDALTGLPNRIMARSRMYEAIEHAKASNTKVALLFIDLDGFKTINDSLGHTIGDAMILAVAQRLGRRLSNSDILSRQGGDEFLIILPNVISHTDALAVAKNIIAEFEDSFVIKSQELSTSASVGIALYPDHGETFEELLQNADTAMYQAKELGKNDCCMFSKRMHRKMVQQLKIENDLKNALSNREFALFYQPKIDLARHAIIGVEALLRWKHPTLGMISPSEFIPIAESSGLIVAIGQWVIEEACAQAAAWRKQGIEFDVAVNISAIQFKRGNLDTIVKNALNSSGIPSHTLELELTESTMMRNIEHTLQSVQALKSLGVQLSIDDFGTGYSSLAYLKRFAVDKLKIDQSFVRDIVLDQEDSVIVQTIIQMAKNLNLRTIAEGVENADVLEKIKVFGCDEVQGFHFAKPMPNDELERFFSEFIKG
jgi:diguanylate cyclase (GGDEF)-like protein/PAS domain S-box-containing protein